MLTAHGGDNDPGGFVSEFNQIHSAFAWQAGDQAYVVIVDNEEFTDVDIFEITDPTNAVFISELDLNDFDVAQDELLNNGNFQGSFLHDMVVKEINGKWTMLLSYWDGGWVLLDVDDPANPVFIDDSEYPYPDSLIPEVPFPEGNAHQAEFSPNGKFIIGTDEDFSPYRLKAFNITSGPNAGSFPGGEFGFTVPIATYPDEEINGPTIYGGLACPSNEDYGEQPPVPDASTLEVEPGEERILVALRGLCFFSEKIEVAQEAGYDAVVIANHHGGSGFGENPDASLCGSQGHDFTPEIAAVCTGHRAFHLLFNTTPGYEGPDDDAPPIGTLGEDIQASALFDGWGYVRLLDRNSLEEIDAYAIDEALDPDFAFGFGALSVHEVAVDPVEQGLAYLSYYSGGLRVIRYGDRGIKEVGHYIDKKGNDFWGVEVHFLPKTHQKLILASDRDSGLWIFKFTGRTDKRFERFVGRNARLSGAKEVPGPGDPDGRGTARIRLHANAGEVCYRVNWKRIGSPTAAHIHEGTKDVAGPVVVTLFQGGQSGKRRLARGCIDEVDRALVADIVKRPRHYYVNVHNAEFPGGAIRGQLFNP
ncbi:MAG: CHRD domain-containing protein [Actinobacteria bacterium]|nr:CHRD domain-containing protein [Actinomycetota bacterium]